MGLSAKDFLIVYGLVVVVLLLYISRRQVRRPSRLDLKKEGEPAHLVKMDRERVLNVVFNFNGHTFDAYEALGLPAGSSAELVETAFQAAMADCEEGRRDFLRMAYNSIRKKQAG